MKTKPITLLGLGFVLQVMGGAQVGASGVQVIPACVLLVLGTGIFVWGSLNYVAEKGLPESLGKPQKAELFKNLNNLVTKRQ